MQTVAAAAKLPFRIFLQRLIHILPFFENDEIFYSVLLVKVASLQRNANVSQFFSEIKHEVFRGKSREREKITNNLEKSCKKHLIPSLSRCILLDDIVELINGKD